MVAAQLMRRARSPRILRLHIRAHREEGPDLLTSWCQFRIHPEAVLVLLALVPEPATPQVVDPNLWGADGNVLAVQKYGNTIYIAGNFRAVGPSTGGGVPVDHKSGAPLRPFARVAGSVYATLPDGEGGWFIGGKFHAVGGLPRSYLAHILGDGSVAAWSANTDGDVASIARIGRTLYVGGYFTRVGSQPRHWLAAVDAVTGEVTDWDPNALGRWFGGVDVLAARGPAIYVGGLFTAVGGKGRNCIAELDAKTGAATDWAPEAEPDYEVKTLAVAEDVVYVGGFFRSIGGQPRNMIAALDASTGRATAFDARASGQYLDEYHPSLGVYALAVHGRTLYVGGYFDHMGGQARTAIAALDARTGAATDWDAAVGGAPYVYALAAHGDLIYAGGAFSQIGGRAQSWLAALDARTARATDWNPRPNSTVLSLSASGDAVYAGGWFDMMWDWQRRVHIAALDAATGAVKPWNPNPDGAVVTALAVSGGVVYVAGDFETISSVVRRGIAAIDTVTGAATVWDAHCDGPATTLVEHGQTLYAAGRFGTIGGKVRPGVAALDLTTAEASDWDPAPDWPVRAIAVDGNTVYLGGIFGHVNGQARKCLAAVDAVTGELAPWRADVDGFVDALLVSGSTVYVGGEFYSIAGQTRYGIAAVDAASGAVAPWDPKPSPGGILFPEVQALAMRGQTLYVGGDFSAVGGQPRTNLAALDAATAEATSWDPGADGLVWSLTSCGNTLYAGGGFSVMGGSPCVGVAAIEFPDKRLAFPVVAGPESRSPAAVTLVQNTPNPVLGSTLIRYALPAPSTVSLVVFDLEGRCMATLLDHAMQCAGTHEAPVSTAGWPSGCYLYRLEAGGVTAARKMLVVR